MWHLRIDIHRICQPPAQWEAGVLLPLQWQTWRSGTIQRHRKAVPLNGCQRQFRGAVWADVENFLRNPGLVIKHLQERLVAERSDSRRQQDRLGRLENTLAGKAAARNRILGLFRKGRISEADLGRQMDEIDGEETGPRAQIEELSSGIRGVANAGAQIQSTQALLEKLWGLLSQGLSWEIKRQLIEALFRRSGY